MDQALFTQSQEILAKWQDKPYPPQAVRFTLTDMTDTVCYVVRRAHGTSFSYCKLQTKCGRHVSNCKARRTFTSTSAADLKHNGRCLTASVSSGRPPFFPHRFARVGMFVLSTPHLRVVTSCNCLCARCLILLAPCLLPWFWRDVSAKKLGEHRLRFSSLKRVPTFSVVDGRRAGQGHLQNNFS